jgi:basic endochitinase B
MKFSLVLFLLRLSFFCSSQTAGIVKSPLIKNVNSKSNLQLYLNEKKWNELFPNRSGVGKSNNKQHIDFYSFKAFTITAKHFPDFLNGKPETKKRELAAFLANIAQETSGGWKDAEGGYFKWGLYFVEEQQSGSQNNYIDSTKKNYPAVNGKSYFGRGPKQLSWNYNYGQFSEAWFGTKDSLLSHPELLSENSVVSFASALWFWMTPQFPKPSCHDIMAGNWKPTENDLLKGRVPGFGATVNVINGGVECGAGVDLEKTAYRYAYYQYFCNYLQVAPGDNIQCTNQKPFGQ